MTALGSLPRFHLAFPVHDLAEARRFDGVLLGCPEGRSAERWVDFDFYGHQLVAQLCEPGPDNQSDADNQSGTDKRSGTNKRSGTDRLTGPESGGAGANEVHGQQVPVRHFGVILSLPDWQTLTKRLAAAGVRFIIEPQVRFAGQVGEQATCFFPDPSGNVIELKAFAADSMVFAR